jgi:hypothetical protein
VTPRIDPGGLRRTRAWEYGLRFVFGGVVTACTGLVAQEFGPSIGGLFLAFPAILPASLTLVKRHDGRAEAVDDARGARLGTVGLAAFAVVVWRTTAAWPPPLTLATATLAWIAVGVGAWGIQYGRRRSMGPRSARQRRHRTADAERDARGDASDAERLRRGAHR